jgi:formyl-CoA transferase
LNRVPCGPINTIDQVFADPQVRHSGCQRARTSVATSSWSAADHQSRTPSRIRTPPPLMGEHTDEVLRELGYDDERIAALREAGVI